MSTSTQQKLIKNQLFHIENSLIALTTSPNPPKWLLMAGHYPIYSSGEHGDISELVTYLQPLISQYKVDGYICGHDHILEHLQKGNTQYFVVGAGTMTDSLGKQSSKATLKWSGVGYAGFAVGIATSTSLTISFIDVNNYVKYSYSIRKYFSPTPTVTPTAAPTESPTESPTEEVKESGSITFTTIWNALKTQTAQRPVLMASAGFIIMFLLIAICYTSSYRNRKSNKMIASGQTISQHSGESNSGNTKSGDEAEIAMVHKRSFSTGDFPNATHNAMLVPATWSSAEVDVDGQEDNTRKPGGLLAMLTTKKPPLSIDTKNFRNMRYHRGNVAVANVVNSKYKHDLLDSAPPAPEADRDAKLKRHLRRATVGALYNPRVLSGSRASKKGYAEIGEVYQTDNEMDSENIARV